MCEYLGIRYVSFPENFEYVLSVDRFLLKLEICLEPIEKEKKRVSPDGFFYKFWEKNRIGSTQDLHTTHHAFRWRGGI